MEKNNQIWSCLWKESRPDPINIGLVMAPTQGKARKIAKSYAGPKMKVFEVALADESMVERGFKCINFNAEDIKGGK